MIYLRNKFFSLLIVTCSVVCVAPDSQAAGGLCGTSRLENLALSCMTSMLGLPGHDITNMLSQVCACTEQVNCTDGDCNMLQVISSVAGCNIPALSAVGIDELDKFSKFMTIVGVAKSCGYDMVDAFHDSCVEYVSNPQAKIPPEMPGGRNCNANNLEACTCKNNADQWHDVATTCYDRCLNWSNNVAEAISCKSKCRASICPAYQGCIAKECKDDPEACEAGELLDPNIILGGNKFSCKAVRAQGD